MVKSVIGRADAIQVVQAAPEQQRVVITAERRIGQTTVNKKLRAEPPAGWMPVFQDLEKGHAAGGVGDGGLQGIALSSFFEEPWTMSASAESRSDAPRAAGP